MVTPPSGHGEEPKLSRVLREDLKRGDFGHSFRREFNELREFFLDEKRKKQLEGMSVVKRWFHIAIWLLKALFLKLTPFRRVFLVLGIVCIVITGTVQFDRSGIQYHSETKYVGLIMILFVLMLELKDKLLARDELMAGHAVQEALMPEVAPAVPGWDIWLFTRPANEVGGDLLDHLAVSPERHCVALGDVAGKGLRAALLMAKLQATMRALLTEGMTLPDLGAKMNEIFYRDRVPNTFASLVAVELMVNSGSVRILNAGHMPPLILGGGPAPEELPKGGPGLGIFQKAEFTEQRRELKEGEILFVYSDGLTDARNEAGEFFGDKRLMGLLPTLAGMSSRAAGERVVAEIDRFVADAARHDDLSLIILKRALPLRA
jgi:hypothetical protein